MKNFPKRRLQLLNKNRCSIMVIWKFLSKSNTAVFAVGRIGVIGSVWGVAQCGEYPGVMRLIEGRTEIFGSFWTVSGALWVFHRRCAISPKLFRQPQSVVHKAQNCIRPSMWFRYGTNSSDLSSSVFIPPKFDWIHLLILINIICMNDTQIDCAAMSYRPRSMYLPLLLNKRDWRSGAGRAVSFYIPLVQCVSLELRPSFTRI